MSEERPTTLAEARLILVEAHRQACLRIHAILIKGITTTTSHDFPEITAARVEEKKAAENFCRVNWVQSDLERSK